MEQDHNRMAGSDFLSSLVFMLAGGLVIYASLKMRIFRTIIVSPGLFPAIIGGVFILFGAVIFIIALRRGGAARAMNILSPENLRAVWRAPRFRRGMVVLLSILVYVLLFGHPYLAKFNFSFDFGGGLVPVNFGFLITTGGYLLFTFLYLKAMSKPAAIAVSLLTTLFVFYAFSKGFGIPIP
ncbi:MAG: tripartite tricarboxylate transporter TctB family protein [Planctomycetota bacterium]|jgi:hypothetical protein|nr:tripartite tricarboxylate transporter TctB family protein [Planctomycetota bacterium]